jgi:hypothetical protein
MVLTAYLLRFEADSTILLAYVGICASCIIAYHLLRKRVRRAPNTDRYHQRLRALSVTSWRRWGSVVRPFLLGYIECSVAVYVITGAIIAVSIPADVSILAFCLAGLTILVTIFYKQWSPSAVRFASYFAAIYVGYLSTTMPSIGWAYSFGFNFWLGTIAASVALVVAFSPREQFELSTLDLLIVLAVAGVLIIPTPYLDQTVVSRVVIRSLVIVYACESLLAARSSGLSAVGLCSTLSLVFTGAHLFHQANVNPFQ